MDEKKLIGPHHRKIWLLAILSIALILRASVLFWSLSFTDPLVGHYHPDEPKIIEGAYDFPAHILDNRDLRYPTFLHYTIGILSLPVRLLRVSPDFQFHLIYLVGRLLSLALGMASIYLTFLVGKRLFGDSLGLMAAGLLTFTMYHVDHSVWATTDITSSFFMILVLYLGIQVLGENRSAGAFLVLGAVFGLLAGTKYTGLIAIFPLTILYSKNMIAEFRTSGFRKTFISLVQDRKLYGFLLAAAIAFFISTPGAFLHPRELYRSILFERNRLALTALPLTDVNVWISIFDSARIAMGLPLLLTALFGLCLSFWNRYRSTDVLALALTVLLLLAYFGSSILPRYLIIILPVLAIFASLGIREIFRWQKIVGFMLAALVLSSSLLFSLFALSARFNDPRTAAAHYIESQFTEGTHIGIGYSSEEYGWITHAWRYPRIDFNRYVEVDVFDAPDVILLSSADFYQIEAALDSGLLDTDYNWPSDRNNEWYLASPPSPRIFHLFEDLLTGKSAYCLEKTFPSPVRVPIEFPPPEIRIYILDPGGDCH